MFLSLCSCLCLYFVFPSHSFFLSHYLSLTQPLILSLSHSSCHCINTRAHISVSLPTPCIISPQPRFPSYPAHHLTISHPQPHPISFSITPLIKRIHSPPASRHNLYHPSPYPFPSLALLFPSPSLAFPSLPSIGTPILLLHRSQTFTPPIKPVLAFLFGDT